MFLYEDERVVRVAISQDEVIECNCGIEGESNARKILPYLLESV